MTSRLFRTVVDATKSVNACNMIIKQSNGMFKYIFIQNMQDTLTD